MLYLCELCKPTQLSSRGGAARNKNEPRRDPRCGHKRRSSLFLLCGGNDQFFIDEQVDNNVLRAHSDGGPHAKHAAGKKIGCHQGTKARQFDPTVALPPNIPGENSPPTRCSVCTKPQKPSTQYSRAFALEGGIEERRNRDVASGARAHAAGDRRQAPHYYLSKVTPLLVLSFKTGVWAPVVFTL